MVSNPIPHTYRSPDSDVLLSLMCLDLSVNVNAMADIVQDLMGGGLSLLGNAQWLLERATAVGLETFEYEALESLRVRLLDSGALLLGVGERWWD